MAKRRLGNQSAPHLVSIMIQPYASTRRRAMAPVPGFEGGWLLVHPDSGVDPRPPVQGSAPHPWGDSHSLSARQPRCSSQGQLAPRQAENCEKLRTAQDWILWASRRAAGDAAYQERQRLRLTRSSIHLTEDGVIPVDLSFPSAGEVLQGPVGAAYSKEGVVVATDGALMNDGAMGAAFVALGDKVPACSAVVFGSEASIRLELTGLAMALEECPVQEDPTLLTGSK